MKTGIASLFSEQDLIRIKGAVGEAEQHTSAEIVPFIVDRSDGYDDALWRGGLIACFAGLGLFLLLRLWTDTWVPWGLPGTIGIALLLAALVMVLIRTVPPVTRLFAGHALMHHRCSQRAQQAFLSEEVFATSGRTGILIFVSLLEHVVIIIGDSGINRSVPAAEWSRITEIVVRSIKNRTAGEGMVEAIRAGADLLKKHHVSRAADDRNELDDQPRRGGTR